MLNAGIIRKTELKRNYMMATDNQKSHRCHGEYDKKNKAAILSTNK